MIVSFLLSLFYEFIIYPFTHPKDTIKSLLQALLFLLFVNTFFFQLSVVPTGSMVGTILEGDAVLVSRLHYGPTLPRTILHIPFTQEKIPFTNIPSYLDWVRLPSYRLPGFSKPKRGDCVVIYQPKTAALPNVPTDVQVAFLKRIIGMPGDKFSIVNGDECVDAKPLEAFAEYRYKYIIKTRQRLFHSFFEKNKIRDYKYLLSGEVEVYLTKAQAATLQKLAFIDQVVRVIYKKKASYLGYRFASLAGGNKDHIPAFTIPYKGMEVTIDKKSLGCYLDIIKDYEVGRGKALKVEKDELWIEGKKVKTWKFKQDYFFPMGDNRDDSHDGRGFGPVPLECIQGKAIRVLWSGKNPDRHPFLNLLSFNVRWGRFLKSIK